MGIGGAVSVVPSHPGTLSSYSFSLESRVKLLWVDFALEGNYRRDGTLNVFETLLGGGFSADFLDRRLRVGLMIGPRFRALEEDGVAFYREGEGDVRRAERPLDILAHSPVACRLTADCRVGSMMVGLFYDVDTTYRFVTWQDVRNLVTPDWDTGKIGVSVLYNVL